MGNRILVTAFTAIALAAAPALAGPAPESAFDVGLAVESFKYQEGDFMKESGPQAGLYGEFTRFFGGTLMGQVFLSYVGGDLDYDGGLQVIEEGVRRVIPGTAKTPNTIFNFRLATGYRLDAGGFDVVPFAGFGYRLLSNEITDTLNLEGYGPTTVRCAGYNRDQTYLYIPLGVRGAVALPGGWSVEGVAEYDLFLSGENNSHRGECGMGITFEQDSGSGYRASVRVVSPPLAGNWRLTVEPYFEHWEIDDSNDVVSGTSSFREPANDATSFGLRVGGRY